jgi:hypothetical protein
MTIRKTLDENIFIKKVLDRRSHHISAGNVGRDTPPLGAAEEAKPPGSRACPGGNDTIHYAKEISFEETCDTVLYIMQALKL